MTDTVIIHSLFEYLFASEELKGIDLSWLELDEALGLSKVR